MVGESQRSDGSYMYRYTDAKTGKRLTVYAPDLAELRLKEKQVTKDVDDDIVTDQAVRKMTVNTLFDRYMESRKLAESTRVNYLNMWNLRVRDDIGMMKVVQVKPSHVKLFYAKLDKDGLSRNTIKYLNNLLYPSFEMAVDDDIIRKNPCKDALGDNGEPPKEVEAYSPDQQEKLFRFVEQHKVYNTYMALLGIMIGTGVRCGELIGLTWSDIDLRNRRISINHQLIYKDYGDGYKFHISTPKTDAGIRELPMTNRVYEAVESLRKRNFMLGLPGSYEIEGYTGFIFVTKNDRPMMPSAVNNVLYNIINAYNKTEQQNAIKEKRQAEYLPKISAHALRHTGCTRMAEQGIDIKVLQYIMGHAHVDVTMNVYNHITDRARIETEITKLNAAVV